MSDIHSLGAQDRIVGGVDVAPFAYPMIVSLQYQGSHACGGSLYRDDTVITAAHCTVGDDKDWLVKTHRHDLAKTDLEEGGATYSVIKRITHPKYDPNSRSNIYDIAVWKLNGTSSKRTTLELDDGTISNAVGTSVKVAGWGDRSELGFLTTDKLREVDVPIYTFFLCRLTYLLTFRNIDPTIHVCAGYELGFRDSCQGDSGGPLFTTRGNSIVLVGVTSFGIGCARPLYPGVYSRVAGLLDWIKENA